jgi:RNA polymerase sigma factor (sigma-70 family)
MDNGEKYYRSLMWYAEKLCDRGADAADVVQDAYLSLARIVKEGRGVRYVRAFLAQCVTRGAWRANRKLNQRRELPLDSMPDLAACGGIVEDGRMAELDDRMQQLPPRQRAILAGFAEGLSAAEIAAHLRISKATYHREKARAISALRQSRALH